MNRIFCGTLTDSFKDLVAVEDHEDAVEEWANSMGLNLNAGKITLIPNPKNHSWQKFIIYSDKRAIGFATGGLKVVYLKTD